MQVYRLQVQEEEEKGRKVEQEIEIENLDRKVGRCSGSAINRLRVHPG